MREKYQESYEFDALSEILNMDKSAIPAEKEEGGGLLATLKVTTQDISLDIGHWTLYIRH